LGFAKRCGATTILITGIGSPNRDSVTDFRIETCPQENSGAFTVSLTSAIIRVIQWLGSLFDTDLVERFKEWMGIIELPFKVQVPKFLTDLVIVGDLIREVVAHEVSLKISETSYLPVRSFGLEEFLHGPRVTLAKQSSLLAFTSVTEPRKEDLIRYAEAVGSEVINIDEGSFKTPEKEFAWLAQLLWCQQLALELSKKLNTNPDTVRADQSPYREARNLLTP
jgi:fructoselysine-6-P-deglycase FrlB-like protein